MALDQNYRKALTATRAQCAQVLAPLADRLIFDLANYHDQEGGGLLSVELVGELNGLPNGREKIMHLWNDMIRKGIRGWRVLMSILEKMNPDVRRYLEETADELRVPLDNGYVYQPAQHIQLTRPHTATETGVDAQYPHELQMPQEAAGYSQAHYPMPRNVAINKMCNEDMQRQLLGQVPQPDPLPIGNGFHHPQERQVYEDPERESSGAMEEGPVYRNTALSDVNEDARTLLAAALNPDKDLVVRIGQELRAPPDVLTQCRRAHNSSGLLFSQLNNVTVQDLCNVLERIGMWDLSHKLVQCIH